MKNVLEVIFVLVVLLAIFSSNIFTQDEPTEEKYQTKILDTIAVTVSSNFRPWPSDYTTQTEFSIDVHPQNENIILFSSNASDWPYTTFYGAGVYWSLDGGTNWQGYDDPPYKKTETDPAVVIDLNGNFYVNFMDTSLYIIPYMTGQAMAVSKDSGATWKRHVVAPNSIAQTIFDKNHLMVDKSLNSPHSNRLYCGWLFSDASGNNLWVNHTMDNDTTWSSPVNLTDGLNARSCTGINIQTSANGDVYATYAVYDDTVESKEDAIGFSVSNDSGATWTSSRIYISNNFGIKGFLKPSRIDANSFPSMAVDRSGGAYDGRIYICWTQQGAYPSGTDPDIVLTRSLDGGITWIPPVRVNDDPINNGRDQYFPWITVDQSTGNVMVVFYDSREDPMNFVTGVWMAVSTDGGSIWQNIRVSDATFVPKPIVGHHGKPNYQGDYIGIAALNNVAYPVWADDRTGNYQAWMSVVRFGSATSVETPTNSNTPVDFVLEQNYPNPFNPTTTITYSIPKKGYVSLKVYDVLGNEITTLVNDEKFAGNHKIEFDASNLASGIYLYTIQMGSEYSETKKMILIR